MHVECLSETYLPQSRIFWLFSIPHEMVSDITDTVLPDLEEWQTRPLMSVSLCFCGLYVHNHSYQYETKKYAVYTILGYTMEGNKDILGLWLNETKVKHKWMSNIDEIKAEESKISSLFPWMVVSGLKKDVAHIS